MQPGKRPRNVHSKRHGPVEHLRLLKTGSERLSFVNCRTFGSDDASVQSKLSSYVMQLSRLGVGACGVAESRIPGSGCRNVTKDWQLIWSGLPEGQPRQHGVGLFLNSKWSRCLIDWSAVSERILVVRVRISSGINASIVVAYSPTDTESTPEEVKEAFYLQLEAILAALPSKDMLVLLGDFNAHVGTDPEPYGGVMGPHGFGKQQPSGNGERLLQLAGALNLRLANTFFKHSNYRTATHKMVNRNKQDVLRVIDYIAVSKRFMSSVTDCRVFRSFDTGGSDHRMLVLTMRLRLSVAKQHSAKGQPARPYDCSRLQESAATQQCFELAMSNQFSRLVGAQLQSAQDEWTQLTAAASQAAHKAGLNLKPQQRRRDFAISDATLQKIERKHAAHAAVLSSPNDATRADYREANNAARRAVKKDQERYFKQQALFAEHALKAGNLAVFHKHVLRIFKEQQGSSSAAPTAVLGGADGKQLFQSREEVVKCFAEHFADVLNCPAKLDQQMQQTIEELVQKMEAGQGANQQSEAAAQPPTVQEVEEAVFACRNGAAPGVDGIAAPMLKLSGTMLKWLHREELVVMLQVMDKVAASLGLRINASKTEILSIDKDWKEGDVPVQQGPEVVISEGVVKEVSQFKYLGSVLVTDGRLDVELNIRRGKAVGRFKQFEKMWGTKHLSLATKVKCYKAYVLPILLFGSECWSLTKVQSQKLERVHSSCLGSILGVRLSDRHTNEHIRKSCGVATLSAYITANRLRWLGHVGRMEEGRLPHIALFSSLHGDMTRPVGRPRHTWEKCVCADLKVLGQDEGSWEASCQIKSAWRKRLWDLTHPWESQRLVRCRRRTKQAIDKHVERHVMAYSGWEDGGSPVPRWWEPPPAPTRVVLDPAASPPPMCDGSGAGFGF